MTLAVENTWTVENANGSKTDFAIGFKVYDAAAIEVRLIAADGTESLQVAGSDYVVTKTAGAYRVDFGGLAGAPEAGFQVAIRPVLTAGQEEAFDDFSKFPASKAEAALDRAYHLIQALQAVLDRAVRMPADENGLVMPAAAELVGKVPVRQSDGSWLLIATTDLEALASRVSSIDALSTLQRLAALDALSTDARLAGIDALAGLLTAANKGRPVFVDELGTSFKTQSLEGAGLGDMRAQNALAEINTPALQSAARVNIVTKRVLTVEDFGAVGDAYNPSTGEYNPDPTEDDDAIQAALDYAAANGDELHGDPFKRYYIGKTSGDSMLVIDRSTTNLNVVDLTLAANPALAPNPGSVRLLHVLGPQPDQGVPLAVSVTAPHGLWVVTGLPDIEAGNTVLLYTSDRLHTSADPGALGHKTRFARVASVTQNSPAPGQTTIVFDANIDRSYSTGSAWLFRCRRTSTVNWIRGGFFHPGPVTNNSTALQVQCSNLSMTQTRIEGFGDNGVLALQCYDPTYDRLQIRNIWGDQTEGGGPAGNGYGINDAACMNPQRRWVYGENCRHVTALGQGTTWRRGLMLDGVTEMLLAETAGQGGQTAFTQSRRGRNAGDDQHPGHDGHTWIAGSHESQHQREIGLVLQGLNNVVLGVGSEGGSSGLGLLIENYGKPVDEGPNNTEIHAASGGRNVIEYLLALRNYDAQEFTDLSVRVFGASGSTSRAALLAEVGAGPLEGGGINIELHGCDLAGEGTDGAARLVSRKPRSRINMEMFGGSLRSLNTEAGGQSDRACLFGYADSGALDWTVTHATLTLSDATVGASRTATASGRVFKPDNVGDELREVSGGGVAVITRVISATVAEIEITTAFSETVKATSGWKLVTMTAPIRAVLRGVTLERAEVSGAVKIVAENTDVLLDQTCREIGAATLSSVSGVHGKITDMRTAALRTAIVNAELAAITTDMSADAFANELKTDIEAIKAVLAAANIGKAS